MAFFRGNDEKKIPAFYESFIDGLDKYNNSLLVYAHGIFCGNFGRPNEDICKEICDFNPDIAFLFNNAFFDISDIVKCPIVVYEVDTPLYYSNWNNMIANRNRYMFVVTQVESINYLVENGFKEDRIFKLPFFSEISPQERKIEENIVFIGSLFTNKKCLCINNFMMSNPSKLEIEQYHTCMRRLQDNPFLGAEQIFESCHDCADLVKINFDVQELLMALSDEYRVSVLYNIHDLGLSIYGTSTWGSSYFYMSDLNFDYKVNTVYSMQENQDIYNSSKIGISMSHLQAKSGFPWRVMDIMASNACLVTDFHKELYEYFTDVPLQVFRDKNEAYAICKDILKNEVYREKIVSECHQCIEENYRLINHLHRLENIFGMKFSTLK